MRHVQDGWLHKLHLLFTLFVALCIAGYVVFAFIPEIHKYAYRVGTNPALFILAAALLVYHFTYYKIAQKKSQWVATWISYVAITLFISVILQPTGAYNSIYGILWCPLAFLGGMLGLYAEVFPTILLFLGTVLTVTGSYPRQSSVALFLSVTLLNLVSFVGGWLYWRKYYITPTLSTSSHFLQDQIIKSDFILNAMTDGVIVTDSKQAIITFNRAATDITGWTANDAVGLDYHSVMKLIDDKGKPYTNEDDILAQSYLDGKPHLDDNSLLMSKSQKKVSISTTVSPLLDSNQQVSGALVVFRDVSKERQIQQRTADFISTASHEMRTPVAAIEGYLSLALNDKVATIDSRARAFLEKAHTSTQGLGKLFQDLLTSAKADDGRLTNHPSVVEMTKFLQDITNDFAFVAQKKGLTTDFTLGSSKIIDATTAPNGKVVPPLYFVYVDPDRLREVITNLFDNAVKYTDQGKISIGVTADATNVQFYIKDTGQGIPSEDISHLFQKFYRVNNSATRSVGGTGLGLFISAKIIRLYDGQIWVESELGKGSTFFVNLPRLDSQRAEQLKTAAAAAATPLTA
jgi:PAS domain S-box-containing protein